MSNIRNIKSTAWRIACLVMLAVLLTPMIMVLATDLCCEEGCCGDDCCADMSICRCAVQPAGQPPILLSVIAYFADRSTIPPSHDFVPANVVPDALDRPPRITA